MINCELRADLAGYRSDKVNVFGGGNAESVDVGSIVLHRLSGVEGNSISTTSLQSPKNATKAYESGLQSLLKNKPEDAAKDFEKAVAIYPRYADAWTALGKVRLQQKLYGPAKEAFIRAVDADPKLVSPIWSWGCFPHKINGGRIRPVISIARFSSTHRVSTGVVCGRRCELQPDALRRCGSQCPGGDQARSQTLNPRADYLLGMVLVEKKNYADGAAELKTFMTLSPNAPDFNTVKSNWRT